MNKTIKKVEEKKKIALTPDQIENILWSIDLTDYMYLDAPIPKFRKELVEELKRLLLKFKNYTKDD